MTTKYKYGLIGIALILMLGNVVHAQTQTGYRIPTRLDMGGGRMTGDMWCQYGTNGVRLKIGTQTVTQVGTAGVINGTNATGLPSLDFTYGGGSLSANFNGFNAVYVAGSQVGTSGALTGKLDATGGVGTNNSFNNPTLAGVGTITATLGANGLAITPAELSMVDGATIPLNTATGSITNHSHTGSDGTTQVSHTALTNKGTQTHTQIDDFIASKAVASGIASLDANSLVVQNPASGTSTPGASKTVMSDGTSKISDGWLSNSVTKLGTPTTSNIPEGSNLYYLDSRVNSVIGSSSVGSRLNEQIVSVADGHHFVYDAVLGKWKNATSTASIGFGGVTGVPTDNAYFSATPGVNKIPYSLNGYLDSWLSGILNTIILPATTTAQVGSTTASKVYVSRSQIAVSIDSAMHANAKLMLRMNGINTSQVFIDSSTNNYTVTTAGNTNQSTSIWRFGGASGYFDGVGDYLSVPDNDDWTWGTGDYTIRGWFNPDDSTSFGYMVAHGDGGDNFWYIAKTNAGKLTFYIQPAGGPYTTLLGPTTYNVAGWNHFAVVKEGTTYRIFLNGSLQFETTQATTVGNYAQTLKIGIHMNATETPFKGYLDNIEIVKGTALYTGTFTVSLAGNPTGTLTRYSTKIIAPGGGTSPQVLLEMQTWDTVSGTEEENSMVSGTPTVNYVPGSTTVFGASIPLGTSTLHTIQANGGILSNLGHFTLCFDSIKVITDSDKVSLRSKYLDSFYGIKIKESYARKNNIPWLDASDRAKKQYKQEKFETWKSSNIGLPKYYIDEYLPGSGTTVQSFQVGAFETDYEKYIEEAWASDMTQNDYVQDIKDEQDMDKTKKMLRPSLSDPFTPKIIKAGDGSALSLDDTSALTIMAIQEQDERLRNMRAEIEALKALINK